MCGLGMVILLTVHVSGGCDSHGKGLCPTEQSKDKLLKHRLSSCLICFRNRVPSLVLPRGIASGPATLDLCPDTTGCVTSPGTPLPGPVFFLHKTRLPVFTVRGSSGDGIRWGKHPVALKCKVSWELTAS